MATYQVETKAGTYQVEFPDSSQGFSDPEEAVKSSPETQNVARPGYEFPSNALSGVSSLLPGLARGVTKGGQLTLDTLGNTAQLLGQANNQTPIIGQEFRDLSKQSLNELIPPVQGVMGNIAEGLGQLSATGLMLEAGGEAPLAVKMGLLGAINARQGGPSSMVIQGAKDAALGQLLHMAGQTGNPAVSGALGAGLMGGAAKLEGAPTDQAVAQAVIGGGLGMLQNPSTDINAPMEANIPSTTQVKKSFKELTTDRVQEQIDKLNELKRTKGVQISSLDSKEAQRAQEAILNDTMLADLKAKQDRVDLGEANLKQMNTNLAGALSGALSGVKAQKPLQFKEQLDAIQAKADADLAAIRQSKDASAIQKAQDTASTTRDLNDKAVSISQELEKVQNKIKSKPIQAAQQVQYNLQHMLEGIYKNYKAGYEKISNEIDRRIADPNSSNAEGFNKDTPISFEEANAVIEGTKNLLKEDGYGSEHPFMKSLDGIGRTIAKSKIEGNSDGQLAEIIPFKSLHNAVKQVLSGEGVGSHEADVLRQQFGDLISAKLKGSSIGDAFNQLQDAYRPVAALNRTVKGMFSPSGTISNLSSGEAFMKRVANGDLSGVDVGILRYLEKNEVPVEGEPGKFKPSGFGTGLGDVSSELSKMGKRFNELTQAKLLIGDERAARLSAIGSEYAERLRQLEQQGQLTQERADAEMRQMKDKLSVQFAKERMDIELHQQRIDHSLEILANKKGELRNMTTQQINVIKHQVRVDFAKQRMDLEQRRGINEKQLNKMESMKARIKALENMANAIGLFGGFRVYRVVRGVLMFKNAMRHIRK